MVGVKFKVITFLGIYKWGDGKTYEGNWEHGEMHGKGKFIWPDGRKFDGNYRFGKKYGMGTFYYKDGRSIYGNWIDGKLQGNVEKRSTDGKVHTVQYSNGKEIK